MHNFKDYYDILQKLISFDTKSSVLPYEDRANCDLILYIKDFFDNLSFKTLLFKINARKYNLFVTNDFLNEGSILFSGHTDTVPFNKDAWDSDPLELTLKNKRLYGRGTTDMKGFLALVMYYCKHNKDNLPISFFCSADEETSMLGARHFIEQDFKQNIKLCVLGEPTENRPIIASKGYMEYVFKIKGKSCHSSDPSLGVNAIFYLPKVLEKLQKLALHYQNIKDDNFKINYPTLNVGVIKAGEKTNIVCDNCEVYFDIRPTVTYGINNIKKDLDSLLFSIKNEFVDDLVEFSLCPLYEGIDAFKLSDNNFVTKLENICRKKAITVNYATEASFLNTKYKTVILGPGSITNAHINNEYISIYSLIKYYKIVDNLVKNFKNEDCLC